MCNWKKNRNYRKVHEDDGSTVYIIKINGKDLHVTSEVYNAYSRTDRHERYLTSVDIAKGNVSIERMSEGSCYLEKLMTGHSVSAETILLEQEAVKEHEAMISAISQALALLSCDERKLIYSLFFQGISARELAHKYGISVTAICKRRDRTLQKLKNFLENSV